MLLKSDEELISLGERVETTGRFMFVVSIGAHLLRILTYKFDVKHKSCYMIMNNNIHEITEN